MRIARWSTRLMCLQYNMEYRPGSQNIMADCLSRVSLHTTNTAEDAEQDLITEIAEISPLSRSLPLFDFKAEREDCPKLTKLRLTILSRWPKVKKSLLDEVKPYFLLRNELAAESRSQELRRT